MDGASPAAPNISAASRRSTLSLYRKSRRVTNLSAVLGANGAPAVDAAPFRFFGKVLAEFLQRRENLHSLLQVVRSVFPNCLELLRIFRCQHSQSRRGAGHPDRTAASEHQDSARTEGSENHTFFPILHSHLIRAE